MTGWIGLHGGGEFLAGDEAFIDAVIAQALQRGGEAGAAPAPRSPLRIAVLPTAAARGRPDLAGANGVAALERAAGRAGIEAETVVVPVIDAASAADPGMADRLAASDLVHLPGGDPDLLPTILPGSRALAALTEALERGAVLAGASAGAMALADPCWTAGGIIAGLGFVPGVLVIPHADAASWRDRLDRFAGSRPAGVGLLGLAERTGIIGRPGEAWTVVGEGEVRWLAADRPVSDEPVVAETGATIRLD
jgi:cyanophycinase